jgi:hypothetical protein
MSFLAGISSPTESDAEGLDPNLESLSFENDGKFVIEGSSKSRRPCTVALKDEQPHLRKNFNMANNGSSDPTNADFVIQNQHEPNQLNNLEHDTLLCNRV